MNRSEGRKYRLVTNIATHSRRAISRARPGSPRATHNKAANTAMHSRPGLIPNPYPSYTTNQLIPSHNSSDFSDDRCWTHLLSDRQTGWTHVLPSTTDANLGGEDEASMR